MFVSLLPSAVAGIPKIFVLGSTAAPASAVPRRTTERKERFIDRMEPPEHFNGYPLKDIRLYVDRPELPGDHVPKYGPRARSHLGLV